MHPILEIALGVALGMTIFLVIIWILGMCVYVCCNNNDCISSCKKSKTFKATEPLQKYELAEEKVEEENEIELEEKVEEKTEE